MKNLPFILLFSFIYCSVLVAQQSDAGSGEQIIFLDNGSVLTGVLEEVDGKVVRISRAEASFTIKKKNIIQVVPVDIYTSGKPQSSESLVLLKNKEYLIAEVQEVSNRFVLLKSEGLSRKIPKSKIFKIYPTGQRPEHLEEPLQKMEAYTKLDIASFGEQNKTKTTGRIDNISSILIKPRLTFKNSGLGFQHTIGYRFNPYFGLGVHAGVNKYDNDFASLFSDRRGVCIDFCSYPKVVTVLSSGLSIRGEINQRKIRPYYNIDFGITKSIRTQEIKELIVQLESNQILVYDRQNSRSNPGFTFQPALGVAINSRSLTLLLDIGFQFSAVNYESDWLDVRDDQTFVFLNNLEEIRGFIFRVGIML